MTKSKINLIIDILLLLCIAAIGGIGLLMKFVLVPGYLRRQIYGRGAELFLWGMDRHQWGFIHLIIAYVFFGLLILHVILHWRMILEIYRRLIPNRIARGVTSVIITLLTVALFAFSWLIRSQVEVTTF